MARKKEERESDDDIASEIMGLFANSPSTEDVLSRRGRIHNRERTVDPRQEFNDIANGFIALTLPVKDDNLRRRLVRRAARLLLDVIKAAEFGEPGQPTNAIVKDMVQHSDDCHARYVDRMRSFQAAVKSLTPKKLRSILTNAVRKKLDDGCWDDECDGDILDATDLEECK